MPRVSKKLMEDRNIINLSQKVSTSLKDLLPLLFSMDRIVIDTEGRVSEEASSGPTASEVGCLSWKGESGGDHRRGTEGFLWC